jgi:hypothetical protein
MLVVTAGILISTHVDKDTLSHKGGGDSWRSPPPTP